MKLKHILISVLTLALIGGLVSLWLAPGGLVLDMLAEPINISLVDR